MTKGDTIYVKEGATHHREGQGSRPVQVRQARPDHWPQRLSVEPPSSREMAERFPADPSTPWCGTVHGADHRRSSAPQ